MNNKSNNSNNVGSWIGVCTAIGAGMYAATNEPTWIAVGVAIGAALRFTKTKKRKGYRIENKNG